MTEFDTEDRTKDYMVLKGSNGKLTIAFAGLANGLSEVRHDFFNATSGIDGSKIFVKDMRQLWYQQGIPDAPSIPELLKKIQADVKDINPTKVTTIGISAGGFAAILFAELLGADLSHSFGPQTFLSSRQQKLYNVEYFLTEPIKNLNQAVTDHEYFDLLPYMKGGCRKHLIHLCDQYVADTKHGYRLADCKNVEIREYTCTEHGPASFLKREGRLLKVIEDE